MRIQTDIKIREIAGERVAVRTGSIGVDMTKIIAFNQTAEWLWNELTDKDFDLTDVSNLIAQSFNLSEETATADAKKWIDQCLEAGIIDL